MPINLASLTTVDQDPPHYSDMDIETLHKQLLEAAASIGPAAQPSPDGAAGGFQSGRYINIRAVEKCDDILASTNQMVFLGRSQNELDRLTFRIDTSTTSMPVDYRMNAFWKEVPPTGDVDFAFVRPQAVEYNPVIPADYTTAIPSIFSHMEKELQRIMEDDDSEAVVPRAAYNSSATPFTRQMAPLPPRVSALAFHPRTPPLRVVDGNVGEDYSRAPKRCKAQAKKTRKQGTLTSPCLKRSMGRTKGSARAVGEYVCPAGGAMVCKRIGDLNRHLQSRAHQLPNFPCPLRCGHMFSRKDVAKRHSETDKCSKFEWA